MKHFKKAITLTFLVLIFSTCIAIRFAGATTYAQSTSSVSSSGDHIFATVPATCAKSFLGLEPWFQYLPTSYFAPVGGTASSAGTNGYESCDIMCFNVFDEAANNICGSNVSDIPLVLVAIIDDLLIIAGLVTLGFVFYGAFLFITSQGNAESSARARTTVINSLIGMAIAIIAITTVSFLGNFLSGNQAGSGAPQSGLSVVPGNLPTTNADQDSVRSILTIVFSSIGAVTALIVVIAGFRYILSAGDPQKTAQARNAIIYSLVGMVVAMSAYAIVSFVGTRL